jgi:putative SOS response-associated peptidase YedK
MAARFSSLKRARSKRDDRQWQGGPPGLRIILGANPASAPEICDSVGNQLINARAETFALKPSFRSAFKSRRCLVVAEWLLRMAENDREDQAAVLHPARRRIADWP